MVGEQIQKIQSSGAREASATYTNPTICPLLKLSSGCLLGRCVMVFIISGDLSGSVVTSGADSGAVTPGMLLRLITYPSSPPTLQLPASGVWKGPSS